MEHLSALKPHPYRHFLPPTCPLLLLLLLQARMMMVVLRLLTT